LNLCDYGCGKEGNYYFRTVKKWCCSKSHNSCPARRNYMSINRQGKKHPLYGKSGFWKNKQRPDHSKRIKGENHPLFGKKRSNNTKKRIGESNRLTIFKIKKRYPFFSKIEEMRYNPGNQEEKEIQVHCKNHNCPNSKERDGWFTPTKGQISKRIEVLENPSGFGESNFYCSESCKISCPLYRSRGRNLFKIDKSYTQEEYNQFRNFVLERDKHKCQYCGEKADHVHHERPQKLEPFFALDPDLAWSVCKKCHYEKGHKDECSTGRLSSIVCNKL
jgi:hypothetical protein